jgi:hypothetical protein
MENRDMHRFMKEETSNDYTKIHKFEIYYEATFSNGFAEVSAPNAVFDGTGTAAKVYVDSTSASDTNVGGAGHAEKVTIIGYTASGFVTDEVSLAGTTAVQSSETFVRVFHAYVSEWGSGGDDAAGTITVQDDAAGTNKYLTIAAGANESDGAAIFMPAAFNFTINHVYLTATTGANVSAVLIKYLLTGVGNGADADFDYKPFRAATGSGGSFDNDHDIFTASGEAKITWQETYKGAGAEDGYFKIEILVWE